MFLGNDLSSVTKINKIFAIKNVKNHAIFLSQESHIQNPVKQHICQENFIINF